MNVCTYVCLRPISSRISQIGPPVLEKYFILPFRKENFSKRENKLLLQSGWIDLANFFWPKTIP